MKGMNNIAFSTIKSGVKAMREMSKSMNSVAQIAKHKPSYASMALGVKLTPFQIDQIELIAKYHPYSYNEVERVYLLTFESFDKTVIILESMTTFATGLTDTLKLAKENDWDVDKIQASMLISLENVA